MNNNKTLAKVYHYDLYGKREDKYKFLNKNSISSVNWEELDYRGPEYFFVKKDFSLSSEYEQFVKVDEMFKMNSSGIKTHHDAELVSFTKFDTEFNQKYSYKPLDNRFINYDLNKIVRHRYLLMKNLIVDGKNLAILLMKTQVNTDNFSTVQLTQSLADINFYGFQTYTFPLYLYQTKVGTSELERIPNLNLQIVNQIAEKLNLKFIPDHLPTPELRQSGEHPDFSKAQIFNPLDILDYIYAILHSPTYRQRYKEFLKIDFPRIPFTSNVNLFWQLVQKGKELRQYHLMEHANSNNLITDYPVNGTNIVENIRFEQIENLNTGKVYINQNQYFNNVSKIAWEFYIGGYQPAQKWLKDRKGKTLSFEDVLHYQKIIVALVNTNRIMLEINGLITEWPIK